MFHGKICFYSLQNTCALHASHMLRMCCGGLWLCVGCGSASQCWGWFDMNWCSDVNLPCLMDGVLAEVSARRCLYFFPLSLYVWRTHFHSSLARFKQAQQESKSVHHLPLLMLELIRDFPKECFFRQFEFLLSRLEGIMIFIQHSKIQCSWIPS